jgi:hypothetical protein
VVVPGLERADLDTESAGERLVDFLLGCKIRAGGPAVEIVEQRLDLFGRLLL